MTAGDDHPLPPLLSADGRHLVKLIVASILLTAAAVGLSCILFGPDLSPLSFDREYALFSIPPYDPVFLHQGDLLATFALALFFIFATGSALLGSSLFTLLYLTNLAKIYVLKEHLVHQDIWLLPELWKGVDWLPRFGMVAVSILFFVGFRCCFNLRLPKIRIFVVTGLVLIPIYALSYPAETLTDWMQKHWIHNTTRDPYGIVLFNGPVMASLVYEMNYQRLVRSMAGASEQPAAWPEFDFRGIPAEAVIKKPNIYVLMLESYLDPYYFHKVHFNIPPVQGILASQTAQKNTMAFYTIRSTAAVEFEVLCGLPNQEAYVSRIFNLLLDQKKSLDCLPRFLSKLGYTTIASHPNTASMYNRGNAYPILGFQRIYFSPDLDMDDKDSVWLNDRSFLQQNLAMVKKQLQTHQPFLNYIMTVGGHFPYDLNAKRPPMLKIQPLMQTLSTKSLQLSYYTSRAVSEYVQALRTLDPHALIIIMGDHFPYFINRDDGLIQWEAKHDNTSEPSFTPVHRLYNLDHQTFGLMVYQTHVLPLKSFEQFDVPNIVTNIMTGGHWCQQHQCLQQMPYMLTGPNLLDRSDPEHEYCHLEDMPGATANEKAKRIAECSEAKRLQQQYLLMYQQMLYPFFS